MIRRLKVWLDTRWFMRHWEVNRETARRYAETRRQRIEERRRNG